MSGSIGEVVERYEYGDYGVPTITAGPAHPEVIGETIDEGDVIPASAVGNHYMFTGRRFDPETGLYWYRTRYLDPIAGRFTSRDVIGNWGDPANLGNGYAYVANNPWTLLDPFGLSPKESDLVPAFRKTFRNKREYDAFMRWLDKYGKKGAWKKRVLDLDDLLDLKAEWELRGKPDPAGSGLRGHRERGKGGKMHGIGLAFVYALIDQYVGALEEISGDKEPGQVYRLLLLAISRGDLVWANELAYRLYDALVAAGFDKAAGTWWKAWWEHILPRLTSELARIRGEPEEPDSNSQTLPMPAEGNGDFDLEGAMEDPGQRRLPMPASGGHEPVRSNCGPVPMPTG